MTYAREQILNEVLSLLNSVVGDWEFEGTVGNDTRVFADLALESLDLVILGSKIQERFGQTFPFPQFFAEIGQCGNHDTTIGQWVDFIGAHLGQPPVTTAAAEAV